MNFTKEELRIIETLAYNAARIESHTWLELADKSIKQGSPELYDKYLKHATEMYDKLMTITAKAGFISEGNECGNWCPPNCIHKNSTTPDKIIPLGKDTDIYKK